MDPEPAHEANSDVVIVVVLFHPDEDSILHIQQQVAAGFRIVAVSNGIAEARRVQLLAMSGVTLVDNAQNVGLARALNQGLEVFLAGDARFVVLLDQDSRLPSDTIMLLKQTAERLMGEQVPLACVAPRLVDQKAPEAIVGARGVPLTVATSGSLLMRDAVVAIGPMWEELFIDGIDHEWCFRARAAGYRVILDDNATMMHHMGDAGIRIGNRFRPIHRSPLRHYHIVRNTLWLQRCRYIPLKWRMQELIKLAYRAPVYVVVSSDRRATLRSLAKALTAGIGAPRRVTGWSA